MSRHAPFGAELLLKRIQEPERDQTNLVLRTELRVRESSVKMAVTSFR